MVMRNRILAITRGSIPYVPELRPLTGSVTATILMQQLDYWFERHPDGFYKFQDASPDNPAYRPGDSWSEELNFSVAELRNAFDQIGHRHKSKTEWNESTDPFNGKFYCCYTDRRTRLTFYFRNHAKVDAALDALVASQTQSSPPTSNGFRPPVHAKSAGNPANPAAKPAIPPVSEDSAFAGNAQSAFTGNAQNEAAGTGHNEFPVNGLTQSSRIDNPNSPEMQNINSAYTENTGLQKTTHIPPQLPGITHDAERTKENRRSCGVNDNPETLVYPRAEPAELEILGQLIAGCRPENRQAVLDEVEGARLRGTLRAGIVPFGRALVRAEAEGAFVASQGVAVLAARRQAQAHAVNLEASRLALSQPTDQAVDGGHTWTAEQLELLPPKMRERVLAKMGQGGSPDLRH